MPSVSARASSSTNSIDSNTSRTHAQLKQSPHSSLSSLTSSSRAPSDAPADTDSKSFIPTASRCLRSSGLPPNTTISLFESPNRSRRRTRSVPDDDVYGPPHLEHEYSLAYEDLRSATIYALYRLGYTNPKRKSPDDEVNIPSLNMILAAKFPDVERARRRINEADRKLTEAIEMGQTWDNTSLAEEREILVVDGEVVGGIDDDEMEIRKLWAKFEHKDMKNSTSSITSDVVDSGANTDSRKQKRGRTEDSEGVSQDKRRKVETKSSSAAGEESASKSVTLERVTSNPPQGRRSGLRSANAGQKN